MKKKQSTFKQKSNYSNKNKSYGFLFFFSAEPLRETCISFIIFDKQKSYKIKFYIYFSQCGK